MARFWTDTITVYSKENAWAISTYQNCFYGSKKSQSITGSSLSASDTIFVRIPCPCTLSKGDIVVLGEVNDTIKGSGNDFLSMNVDKSFKVNVVKINNKINPKHIYAGNN